jgi:hypothetical protein
LALGEHPDRNLDIYGYGFMLELLEKGENTEECKK